MRNPQLRLSLGNELIIDNFAGGGGASVGIEQAFERPVDVAINHDAEALAMHKANHPATKHYCEDVFDIDPEKVTHGRQVGLAWFSPDCTYHSKARGGKPFRERDKAKRKRGLAWVVVKWARTVKPRVLMLENVEEFQHWGPLLGDGRPCPERRGLTFRRWWKQLENAGYKVEAKELRACDYGAPTIRKRLFIIARRDGLPIRWPKPTHGPGLTPFRTAAECINWGIPCPSIFERKKPLAEATQRRIAKGIKRFVIDAAEPFIVPVTHQGDSRVHDINEPLRTITTANRGEHALVTPTIVGVGGRASQSRPRSADEPYHTITAKADSALLAPYLVPRYGERPAQEPRTHSVEAPLPTITPDANCGSLVTPFLTKFRKDNAGADINKPAPTITANSFIERPGGCVPIGLVAPVIVKNNFGDKPCHGTDEPLHTITTQHNKHAFVGAFLAKHYGDTNQRPGSTMQEPVATITACDHNALVTSHLTKFRGTCQHGQDVRDPLHTITGQGYHFAEVRAFLIRFYSEGGQWGKPAEPMHTIPTRDRIGLVTVKGEDYIIADIGMRMLKPRELYSAQGFPDTYVITPIVRGKPLTQSAQVRMVGNSVSPPVACALVEANFKHEEKFSEVVA